MHMPKNANRNRQESRVNVETSFTLCFTNMKLNPKRMEDIMAHAIAMSCLLTFCFMLIIVTFCL